LMRGEFCAARLYQSPGSPSSRDTAVVRKQKTYH